MLSEQELYDLVKLGESERVEFKETARDKDAIRQAICSFANDLAGSEKPGVVVIGLRDDGSCANLTIEDELLTLLGGLRGDGKILPFPVMSVERRRVAGCEVAVVQVSPSEDTPHRVDGRCWIRVGSRRAQATREEERILVEKRVSSQLEFDSRGVLGATINDLDMGYFEQFYLPLAISPEVLEENDRSALEQLRALRFLSSDGRPNPAALLTLAHEPRDFFPCAYIQFLRFAGEEMTDPIRAQREVSGRLTEQLEEVTRLLKANVEASMSVTSEPIHQVSYDYPPSALRQIVYNAVMHRDYELPLPVQLHWYKERIEIISPGGAYGNVTTKSFGEPGVVSYRNPLVAEVMKNAGYIERFGVGIQVAKKALRRNGNPPPEFQVESGLVRVTVRRRA